MKNKFVLIRYILMLWMLCGASYTLSIASAYDRTSSSASLGYQPLHGSTMSVNSSVFGGAIAGGTQISGTYSAASSQTNALTKPTYQFSSTSPYLNASNMGGVRITMSGDDVMRSGWGNPNDDDDEDLPIGTTPVTPIGEPLVLLALAVLYIAFILFRRLRPTRTAPRRN